MNNGRDCPHGRQVGKCDTCDLIKTEIELQQVTAERDTLAAHVRIMRSALEKAKPHVRTCYKQGHAEWSDFESVTGALEFLPQHHLAAHDAELAAKAVKDFASAVYDTGELSVEDAEFVTLFSSEYVAENFSTKAGA